MYSGMDGGTPQSFAWQGIQDFEIGLYVPEPPPPVSAVYPPTGFISSTLQQQLSTTATADGTITYDFKLTCEPLPGQTCVDSSVSSGSISNPYWTPPKADLDWDTPYEWSVAVTGTSGAASSTTTVGPVDIEAEVPGSDHLGLGQLERAGLRSAVGELHHGRDGRGGEVGGAAAGDRPDI